MGLVVFEALAAFGNRWNVAGWTPPETVMGLFHFFEPLGAVAEDFNVP